MSLPDCACPTVLGKPCYIERMAVISGRTEEYIYNRLDEIDSVVLPPLRHEVVALNLITVLPAYHGASNVSGGDLVEQIYLRWITLCRGSQELLAELADIIPHNGGLVECYFLQKVAQICPGE